MTWVAREQVPLGKCSLYLGQIHGDWTCSDCVVGVDTAYCTHHVPKIPMLCSVDRHLEAPLDKLRAMQLAVRIGKLGSCTRAPDPLALSKSALRRGVTRLKTAPDVRLLQRATHHFHSTLGCTGRGPRRMRTPVNLNQFLTGTRGPQGRDITQPHAQTNSGTGFHIFCAICADNRGMEKRPCV